MNPETVLDLFFDAMERTHWSTATADIDRAREATLRVATRARDRLIAEVIEECALDVVATAGTNDGQLRYELLLAAHSLRTQVAASFDVDLTATTPNEPEPESEKIAEPPAQQDGEDG